MVTTLATVAWLDQVFSAQGIAYWIFGGFAVDFHLGEETRAHDDVDVAVLRADFARAAASLVAEGWTRHPNQDEGYATFERAGARVDLAPVARDDPNWHAGALGDDVRELNGVRARVVTRLALVADKSELRDNEATRAKDAADLRKLTQSR